MCIRRVEYNCNHQKDELRLCQARYSVFHWLTADCIARERCREVIQIKYKYMEMCRKCVEQKDMRFDGPIRGQADQPQPMGWPFQSDDAKDDDEESNVWVNVVDVWADDVPRQPAKPVTRRGDLPSQRTLIARKSSHRSPGTSRSPGSKSRKSRELRRSSSKVRVGDTRYQNVKKNSVKVSEKASVEILQSQSAQIEVVSPTSPKKHHPKSFLSRKQAIRRRKSKHFHPGGYRSRIEATGRTEAKGHRKSMADRNPMITWEESD